MVAQFWQFVRFCCVGFSGFIIDFGLTYLLKEKAHCNKYVANSIGFIVAATSNFVLNRVWTFASTDANIGLQYAKFLAVSVGGLIINNLIVHIMNDRLRLNFYISKLFAVGVVMFWNYIMNMVFTFG